MILEADNVTVSYLVGAARDIGIKEYLVRHLYRNGPPRRFAAVKNVSFSLERGEMMGIIGSNGAGKSTLLKVISGILPPTGGSMRVSGSVAALLELAGGFDGDLTVRENTYLRGAMLGYSRRFMNQHYDEIIAFAELEDFQDPKVDLSAWLKDHHTSMAALSRSSGVSVWVFKKMKNKETVGKCCAEKVASAMGLPYDKAFTTKHSMEPLSPGTIHTYHRTLSAVLFRAVKWGVYTK